MAGEKKLEQVYTTDLKALRQKAEITGSIEDIQQYDDMVSYCEQFEQKIHDLELSRMISIQMAFYHLPLQYLKKCRNCLTEQGLGGKLTVYFDMSF